MATFLGLDVEQAEEHAERLRSARKVLDGSLRALETTIRSSEGFWRGPDVEAFRGRWGDSVAAPWQDVLDGLADRAQTLIADVDEQVSASEHGESGGAEGGDPTDAADQEDGDSDRGTVDPEVAKDWEGMTDSERRKVAQENVNAEFEKYGMDPVEITFKDIKGNGYWSEGFLFIGGELAIDEDKLADPDILHTLAHEVRHAAQHEFIERTERDPFPSIRGDDRQERFQQIEDEHGVTRDEIEEWGRNFGPFGYKSSPKAPEEGAGEEEWAEYEEEFQEYLDQPVEVDARESGREFVDGLTEEELHEFQRAAGVEVDEP
ncbi:WXG100 family type VII secretion target [Brachybacterium paraconglomeratum]